MFEDFSNLKLFIPLIVTFIGMGVVALKIFIDDLKKLSIKLKWLLLFVSIGFSGVFIGRIINGSFHWCFLLIIPVYIVFNVLTTKLGKNKFIGQADLDIFTGALTLFVPILIMIFTTTYDSEIVVDENSVRMIQIYTIAMEALTYLFLGYVAALLIALIRFVIERIKKPKEKKKEEITKENKSLKEKVNEASINAYVKATNLKENADKKYEEVQEAKKKGIKIRKRKVPVCVAFFPIYFYMVYAAMFLNLT